MILIYILSILAITYFGISYFQKKTNSKNAGLPKANRVGIIGLLLLSSAILLDMFLTSVDGQSIAVKETPTGVSDQELYPRWYLIPPWVTLHEMDNTVWVWSTSTSSEGDAGTIWAATKGDSSNTIGSKIGFDISVNWKIDPKHGSWIYQNLGNVVSEDGRYEWIEENIISKAVNSATIDGVRGYTVFQANNRRTEIQKFINDKVTSELAANHLLALEVQIRDVHFDQGLEDKIKLTQINRQEAENQKEVTKQLAERELQAIKNKNIAVTEAQGKAEAIRLSAVALENSPKLVEYEYVKALQISAGEGQPIVPSTMIGNSSGMLYQLPK